MSAALIACMLASVTCGPMAEVAVGATHFERSDPGTWWQPEYRQTMRMQSPSIGLGVIGATQRIVLRAGAEWLGCATSSAEAIPTDHARPGDVWRVSHWYGRGCVSDLYLTASNKGRWYLEGGLVGGWRQWTMEIPDWHAPREVSPECAPNCPITPIRVDHRNRMQFGLVLGGGYRFNTGTLALTVRDGRSLGDGWPSIINGLAWSLWYRMALP